MVLSDLWKGFEPTSLDSNVQEEEDAARNKRRIQTSAARVAAARAQSQAQSSKQQQHSEDSFAQRLQSQYLTPSYSRVSHQPDHPGNPPAFQSERSYKQVFRERARCIWSFLQSMVGAVSILFAPEKNIQHVVNTCVADDTNTRMRSQHSERTVVHTVMNTVESVYIRYNKDNSESEWPWQLLHIPTPVHCLPTAKADSLHAAFTSWMLVCASGMGKHWLRLQCPETLLDRARWRSFVLVGDALKANDAAWKAEMCVLSEQRRKQGQNLDSAIHRLLGLRMRCGVHQAALIRKPVALSIQSYWTTLVRLGHLYEQYSFRRAISGALVSLLNKEGVFRRTLEQMIKRFLWRVLLGQAVS